MENQRHFDLKFEGKRVLLLVHPPEGGLRANLKDIQKYLRRQEIGYRHETLFDIYRRASGDFELLANQEVRNYQVKVEVSEDEQEAWLSVVAPDTGDEKMDPAAIKNALEEAKVEKGILYPEIKRILASGESQERVLIAKGTINKHGEDGRIEFVENPNTKFDLGDNTADFKELGLIDNVFEDDLIARITKPTEGGDGYNVRAKILRGRTGKKARYMLGKNVRLDESGTELFASKDGYVVRTGRKISVENILDVNNVDSETGNIQFHGVVRIRGQVEDGFSVEAEKGIEVGGTVGKATLSTRGDIKIEGGVFGATLQADGNVSARFLSEAKVKSGLNVYVRAYILHSEVVAERAVKVEEEEEGFIKGGRTRAGTEIWSSIVGSDVSEEPTALEVGGGVNIRKRFDQLEERLEANLEGFDKIRKNLLYLVQQKETEGSATDERKKVLISNTTKSGLKMTRDLLHQGKLHHELLKQMRNTQQSNAMVMVLKKANPGTIVQIQTSRVQLKEPLETIAFAILGGSLKAMPYTTALNLHKQQKMKKLTT